MSEVLTGLTKLGLEHLENRDIFEEEKKETSKISEIKIKETDFIYDRKMVCPVCGKEFTTKMVKSGKAKLLSTDFDLRPKYVGIDALKYDVFVCTHCGYAALSRFFEHVTDGQRKLIRSDISPKFNMQSAGEDTYEYPEALERYQLALANAVVKKARNGEKAYICLKMAWLYRGYREELELQGDALEAVELQKEEMTYLQNACKGFLAARGNENYPICGMDSGTFDYVLAAITFQLGKIDVTEKMLSSLLTSVSVGKRTKDKARELKDAVKKYKSEQKES